MWHKEGVPDRSKRQDLPEISSQWLLWNKPRGTPPEQPYLQLGITVDDDFEFIFGPDGKHIHPTQDIRFTEGPSLRDNLWEQRNCSSPSVRMLGTRDRPYWSRPNMRIRFTSALAHYLTRAVCPEALRRVMGGRYPNGPREWTQAYNILQGWDSYKNRPAHGREQFRSVNRLSDRRSRRGRRRRAEACHGDVRVIDGELNTTSHTGSSPPSQNNSIDDFSVSHSSGSAVPHSPEHRSRNIRWARAMHHGLRNQVEPGLSVIEFSRLSFTRGIVGRLVRDCVSLPRERVA